MKKTVIKRIAATALAATVLTSIMAPGVFAADKNFIHGTDSRLPESFTLTGKGESQDQVTFTVGSGNKYEGGAGELGVEGKKNPTEFTFVQDGTTYTITIEQRGTGNKQDADNATDNYWITDVSVVKPDSDSGITPPVINPPVVNPPVVEPPVVEPPVTTPDTPVPQNDDVYIPETPVPLTETPVVTEIPDEPAPLAEEPVIEIVEEEVPLVEEPVEEEIVIEDEEVPLVELPEIDLPLSDVPQTGDVSVLWAAMSALSGSGLAALALTSRKAKRESDDEV